MPTIHLPIRQLVEFLLRTGSIDSRFTGFDRANEGARIHRRLQKAAGEGYAAEVFLTAEREMDGIAFALEGRADGIFTDEAGTIVIDEIKTTAIPTEEMQEDMNPCHWAQGMVYGAIYAQQNGLEQLDVRLTYYQIDTDEVTRYTRHFTAGELEEFLCGLLRQYVPWAQRQLTWADARSASLPARPAGLGRGDLPRLCGGQDRTQGRHPAVLPSAHRHRQDDERPFPRPESHRRGQGREALLPNRPQHDPSRRRGCAAAAPRRGAGPCAAQRDPDGQGESVPLQGRRRSPVLSAGGLPLCKGLF